MENSPNLNQNKEQSENKGVKRFNYVYFNFKYNKKKKYKIYFSSNYNASDTLELIEEKSLNITPIEPSILKIYRFKILPYLLKKENEHNEFEIELVFEEENEDKHHFIIRFKDTDRDFYEYNLRIEEIDLLPLELDEQFEIYSDILRNKYKKNQKTKENQDFILSSLLLLEDKDRKYNLIFYFLIFLNCFTTDLMQNHLLAFNPKRIKEIEEIPERILKPIKNIINKFVKNPQQLHIKDEKLRLEITKIFYSLALYFNLHFQKEKINEIFENEKISEDLSEILLNYKDFFKDLILPKEEVIKLIKKAKKYEQILTLLFYLGTDCFTFLDIVIRTKDYIYKFQNEEMNKNDEFYDNRIDIEKYVEPKKEDDLRQIHTLIENIRGFTMIIKNMKLIKFSSLIIEKYSEFYNEINSDKLIDLKFIVDSIKIIDQKFVCKFNLDEKILRTWLIIAKNGKIKNIKILEIIGSNIYFLNKSFNKTIDPHLEILDGINISLIENKKEFFDKWNNINFNLVFESQFKIFLKKISSLITEMKDFGYLFKFYKTNQENVKEEVIKSMLNRFIEILPTYNNNICPNFIEDAVELIYLSDKNKIDIKKFLSEIIEKKLNVKCINDIYINLTEKHKDLSEECNKIIVKYFTEYKENSEPISLAYIIDKCNNIRDDIFSNINKYVLKEDDIFSPNETRNYIFFKELVNRKIIEKIQNRKQKYIVDTMMIISYLQEKIKKCEIQFNLLYPFFKEGGQSEEILKKKFESIFFNDKEALIKSFEKLKSKVLEIIKIKDDFTLIYRYFKYFYPNVHSKDIELITKIILSLNENNLNYFEINYKKDYENYIKYLNEAEKGCAKKSSVFYNQILNNTRKTYENDDIKCVDETNKNFNELRNIFEEDGIDKIDEKMFILCIEPFLEDKDKISSEIKNLMALFKISKNNNEIEIIKNNIILVLKKESIFKAASSIIFFIEQIGAKKGKYTSFTEKVMLSFKGKIKIASIKQKLEFLKNISIDLFNF